MRAGVSERRTPVLEGQVPSVSSCSYQDHIVSYRFSLFYVCASEAHVRGSTLRRLPELLPARCRQFSHIPMWYVWWFSNLLHSSLCSINFCLKSGAGFGDCRVHDLYICLSGHGFCTGCITGLCSNPRPKCPNCRRILRRKDAHPVYIEFIDSQTFHETSLVEGLNKIPARNDVKKSIHTPAIRKSEGSTTARDNLVCTSAHYDSPHVQFCTLSHLRVQGQMVLDLCQNRLVRVWRVGRRPRTLGLVCLQWVEQPYICSCHTQIKTSICGYRRFR